MQFLAKRPKARCNNNTENGISLARQANRSIMLFCCCRLSMLFATMYRVCLYEMKYHSIITSCWQPREHTILTRLHYQTWSWPRLSQYELRQKKHIFNVFRRWKNFVRDASGLIGKCKNVQKSMMRVQKIFLRSLKLEWKRLSFSFFSNAVHSTNFTCSTMTTASLDEILLDVCFLL